VILAAGRGTRMNHLCNNCPKPMLAIQGKPKLEYTLDTLPENVDEVIFIVGYLKRIIQDHFGSEYKGKKIRYVEQKELNGTGGAIHLVKNMIQRRFLVLMGDDLYMKRDLERMAQHDLAVLAYEMEDSSQFGVLRTDKHQVLQEIVERPHDPAYKLVNTAAYMLNEEFFAYPLVQISEKETGLPQTLVTMRDNEHTIIVEKATQWLPIGDPQALEKAQKEIDHFRDL